MGKEKDYAVEKSSTDSGSIESDGDENKERGNWSGKCDFILSAVGFAVGLGNVWRFPHRAYANGGGSFLIPYAIMLVFAGLPLFFMEMGLGQFSSLGPISVWNVVPIARGLGVAMVIISALVCIYYNMIIAYTLYYLFASFTSKLPWADCQDSWQKYNCIPRDDERVPMGAFMFCQMFNSTELSSKMETCAEYSSDDKPTWCDHIDMCSAREDTCAGLDVNVMSEISGVQGLQQMDAWNNTEYVDNNCTLEFDWCRDMEKMEKSNEVYDTYCSVWRTPSDIYWEHEVLDISGGFDEGQDEFRWQLVLCLLLAWIIVYLCLIRGIKSSGKVVYFTATFPYIVLIILLIRNVTLEGAKQGIDFYITPDWDKLKETQVWYQAAIQIFYSLGVAFGGLETMASYNKFKNNIHRDALIVAVLNCATSVFAGFVIFSVIGHMAFKTGKDVSTVADYGPGLAFVAYPEGIALMPVAPLWSILFFFMLLTLGLDSQFAMMETVVTAISDVAPSLRKPWRKAIFTFAVCATLFLLGLPQCARNGVYVMNLFDWYSAGFSLLLISICETLAISYLYWIANFKKDLHMMLGASGTCNGGFFNVMFWIYWMPTWMLITPGLLLFTLIMYGVNYEAITYGNSSGTVDYPQWGDAVGWVMVIIAVIWIPILAIYELVRPYCDREGAKKVLMRWVKPRPHWGPALDTYRTDRYEGTSAEKEDTSLDGAGSANPGFDNKFSD